MILVSVLAALLASAALAVLGNATRLGNAGLRPFDDAGAWC